MLVLLFDCLIVAIVLYTLKDFSRGFVAMLCMTIAVPWMVQMKVGNTYMTYMDFFCLFLVIPLFYHIVINRKRLNKPFTLVILFDLFVTALLIIFSSQLVPLDYQANAFVKKKVYQEGVFLIAGVLAFQSMEKKVFFNALFVVSTVCGIYGIIAYFLSSNPYVSFLTYAYLGQESLFAFFLDESRGGMLGRAYGTMTHPLAWGQYWSMLLGFFLLNKEALSKTVLRIIVPVIAVVNCLISGSRTALLMAFITICFFVGAKGASLSKKKIKWLLGGFFCIICAIPLVSVNNDLANYVESTVFFWDKELENNNSVTAGSNMGMRQNQLETSIAMIKDSPLSGVGYDYQYYSIDNPGVANSALMGFESVVFKKIVEQGAIGMASFLAILFFLYKSNVKYVKDARKKILFIGFFLASTMSFVFTGIQGRSWMYFFIFLLAIQEKNGLTDFNFTERKALRHDP